MKYKTYMIVVSLSLSILGCSSKNILTKNEIENQNKSSEIVTNILFENDLDEKASYSVRKDGKIIIQFDASVSPKTYTEIVNKLRESPVIPAVKAEQSGLEVCPLR